MKKGMIFLCFMLCLLVGVGSSNATEFTNGGFEGGMNPWVGSVGASVSSSDMPYLTLILPYLGNKMAVLDEGATLSQEFDAAGQELVLSFQYKLFAYDRWYGSEANELTANVEASIGGIPFFSATLNDPFGDGTSVLGWVPFSSTLPDLDVSGPITLTFSLGDDFTQIIKAYIDDVQVYYAPPDASVPDASIMFLLGPGLVGLGLFGRRKFFKK